MKSGFIKAFSHDEDAVLVADFISKEFSKIVPNGHNNEYKISALLADMMFYEVGMDAVSYPSVKLGGQAGMNVAIRPDVVDKKLRLIDIADQCYYKNGQQGIIRIESIYDLKSSNYLSSRHLSDFDICRMIHINNIDELKLVE